MKKGLKIFEFRKKVPTDKSVRKMYIYSSTPIKKVVGECEIEKILSGNPIKVWKSTAFLSGISEEMFYSYFEKCDIAYAIKMKNIFFYDQPKDLQYFNVKRAPQSYQYVYR